MQHSRRTFLGMTTAALASSVTSAAPPETSSGDPLGCRADFPVLEKYVYLNSPYITPSPRQVADAVVDFDRSKATDPISLGEMLEEETRLRERFAELVNADVGEIGVLSTTSEGENVVTRALDLQPGDNVVIDDLHYDTTYLLYDRLAKERGVDVRVVTSEAGAAPAELFAEMVDSRTRLVSVSWVSHQNGYRHDLQLLAELAHAHDALLYADAIQGLGAVPLDVRESGIDFFTAGSYKWLLGGFGIAPFYVREALLDRIGMDRVGWRQLDGPPVDGEYQYKKDAGKYGYATPAFGAVYQLRAALDYLLPIGIERIASHSVRLAGQLNGELRQSGFNVLTPARNESQIVAFEHGVEPDEAGAALEAANIRVSLREGGTQVRVGIALFNNRQDVDALLDVVRTLRS